jgi:hypothetical protein
MGMQVAKAVVGVEGAAVSYALTLPGDSSPVYEAQSRSGLTDGIGSMTTRYVQGTTLAGIETWTYVPRLLSTVSYRCENYLNGEFTEVTVSGLKAKVIYRPNASEEHITKEVTWTDRTFAGNALPVFIVKNWDKIKKGESIEFDLFVPFRQETLAFKLTPQFASAPRTIKVMAEARNWLIRQFAPTISFTFVDGVEPTMTAYDGPTQLAINGDRLARIKIDFTTAQVQ